MLSTPKVSVVILARNGRNSLARAIQQAYRVHRETEVIVIVHKSVNGTKQIAEGLGAKVIHYDQVLSPNIERSIGAKEARGGIILFISGDIITPYIQLKPLVKAVEFGVDVALNKDSGPTNTNDVPHAVLASYALNAVLSRPDLKGASMVRFPFAMSRKALNLIGVDTLDSPAKAMSSAILGGLDVRPIEYIHVADRNQKRTLSIGHHVAAVQWIIHKTSERGGHTDLSRNREIVR